MVAEEQRHLAGLGRRAPRPVERAALALGVGSERHSTPSSLASQRTPSRAAIAATSGLTLPSDGHIPPRASAKRLRAWRVRARAI